MKTQLDALRFILQTARDKKCPLILNGDIFHRAVSSIDLVNLVLAVFLEYKDVKVIAIPGNHDLPYHTLENIDRSAYGILEKAGVLKPHPDAFPFGCDNAESVAGHELIVIHRLVLEKDPGFYMGSDCMSAHKVLETYPDAKWILTGDNHESFIVKSGGGTLLNPGSMLRQTAAQIDKVPCIYFVDTEKDTVEKIFVPDPPEMVVNDYLLEEKKRDGRIQAFVSQMKTGSGLGLSFEDNLELYYQNAIEDGVEIPKDVVMLVQEVTL